MTSSRKPQWHVRAALALAALAAARPAPADTLRLGSADGPPETTITVPVGLARSHPVVGVQFELRYPPAYVTTAPPILEAATNHVITSNDLGGGRQRLVVFSRTNAEMPPDLRVHLTTVLGAGSPAGGPSLALEQIVFTDALGNDIPASVAYTFLEAWRRAHFTQAERDDAAVIGDNRDPDGDGVANLVEAASARDPRAADNPRAGMVAVPVDAQGNVRLALRFLRTRDPAAGAEVAYTADSGTIWTNWSTNGVAVTPTGGGDALAEELEASVVSTNVVRYLRLRIQRLPGP